LVATTIAAGKPPTDPNSNVRQAPAKRRIKNKYNKGTKKRKCCVETPKGKITKNARKREVK